MRPEHGLFRYPDTPQSSPSFLQQEHEASPSFDFSSTTLSRRDPQKRFDEQEKKELAVYMREAWRALHRDQGYPTANTLNLMGSKSWGKYPDGEAFGLANNMIQELQTKHPSHLYASLNLEDADDVLAAQAILRKIDKPDTILGTTYFPYERGDRPEMRGDGRQEMMLLEELIENISHRGVKGIINVTPHSPVFPWLCLQYGIAPLSLSNIPALIKEAQHHRFIDTDSIVASGDDGAASCGRFVKERLQCKDFIVGIKDKSTGKTIVRYSEEDLEKVKDKTVVFVEDIISTGGTMTSSVLELLNRGQAKKVIILVTYPIFAGDALHHLGYDARIQIVTSDGRTPIADLRKSNNIKVIPLKEHIPRILELDRQGIDFWSKEGSDELEKLGLCLFPW